VQMLRPRIEEIARLNAEIRTAVSSVTAPLR
jgi:hypothetical protein